MSTRNHRCTSCRKPVHVLGSMCKPCRSAAGTSASDVAPLRDVGPREEPPCAVYVRVMDVRAEGDPWFPDDRRGREREELARIAQDICSECPLWRECAQARSPRDVGVWAGVEWERDESRRYAVRADRSAA